MDPFSGVERSLVLPTSREELWAALTQPEHLSAWFGATVIELEPWAGGRVVFRDRDGTIRRGLVRDVDAPRRFAFRWLPITEGPGGFSDPVPGTSVEFVLEAETGGTRLTVRESTSPFGSQEAGTPHGALLRA
jgi:uncharacterized protein YndB with AHSA1/START domain